MASERQHGSPPTHKRRSSSLFFLFAIFLIGYAVHELPAQSVGINIVGGAGGFGTLTLSDVAGEPSVSQAFWNNVTGTGGSAYNLIDNNGQQTTLSATLRGICGVGSNQLPAMGGNSILMNGFLSNCVQGVGIQLWVIPYDVYDVIVYMSGPSHSGSSGWHYRNPADFAQPTIAEGYSPTCQYSSNFTGSFIEASPTVAGNYYRFRGLTYGSLLVTSTTSPLAGVQVVRMPGPATVPTLLETTLPENRGFARFSLLGTNLTFNVKLYYSWGVNPRVELHGPPPPGTNAPVIVSLGNAPCYDIESPNCQPLTGTVSLTPEQAAQVETNSWYLFAIEPSLHVVSNQIVNTDPRPSLKILSSAPRLTLQWPTSSRSFFLEARTSLSLGQWQIVTNQILLGQDGQDMYSVSLDADGESRFFRLRKSP